MDDLEFLVDYSRKSINDSKGLYYKEFIKDGVLLSIPIYKTNAQYFHNLTTVQEYVIKKEGEFTRRVMFMTTDIDELLTLNELLLKNDPSMINAWFKAASLCDKDWSTILGCSLDKKPYIKLRYVGE